MHGKHATLAAINNPKRKIKIVYCLEKIFNEHKKIIITTNYEIVSSDFIIKKIGKNTPHQGIIAYVEPLFSNKLNMLGNLDSDRHIAILDQITDPQNVGAIIRSAAAFGIKKIILPIDNTPSENAIIAKAASGCLELVNMIYVTNLKSTIEILKKNGFWIAGITAQGKENIDKLSEFKKLAIIIGSEGRGLRPLTLKSCDLLVKISISNQVESLNAATAASIIFYTLSK